MANQTRDVLAGAYRGSVKATLSHMVRVDANGCETAVVCGGVKLEHIADEYAADIAARPACKRCAKVWAREHAK